MLHHLRSALDNLICALVVHRGNDISNRTAFPISIQPGDWKRSDNMWRGISVPDDLAILKKHQPELRSNDPENDPLAILRRFSNYDKHEALSVVYALSGGILASQERGDTIEIEPVRDCIVEAFTGSATILEPGNRAADIHRVTVRVTGPNPEVRMKGDPPLDIALRGAERSLPLDHLHEVRAETIRVIESFSPAFG